MTVAESNLRNADKEAKKVAELATALKRIVSIAGQETAESMKGRKRAEVLELAGLKDEDILKVRGLVNNGWKVAKARKYKMIARGPDKSALAIGNKKNE